MAHTLYDQIINQHPYVSLVARKCKNILALYGSRCINTGYEALSGRLFIAGGTIYLSGKIQPSDKLGLQIMGKLRRWKKIIFYSVTGTINMHIPEGRNMFQRTYLHIPWQ